MRNDRQQGAAVKGSVGGEGLLGPGFIGRVMRMTVYLSVFAALTMLSLGYGWESVSFLIGAAVGLAMLWALRFTASNILTRRERPKRYKRAAAVLAVVKYGILALVVWRFTAWSHASAPAFAAGAAMTQVVLLLKALGMALAPDRPPFTLSDLTRMRQ
jgi:hypothetical protein